MANVQDDFLDWLTWPASLLLRLGAFVASWFVSADTPSFAVIQMMVATLVLAAVLFVIVYLQSLTDSWRSRSAAIDPVSGTEHLKPPNE
ncbi:MAG: hypothetical protein J2P54_08670 [Bradyrhizobiaceae bacterium]|nr:hypothetical protein [Bradyrhizobiaceae bacterium]